jgi:hypothetical protein
VSCVGLFDDVQDRPAVIDWLAFQVLNIHRFPL